MITETIKKQIIEAMKAKDELRLSTLKLLSSSLHNAEIDKRGVLNEEEELEVVAKEAKKRKDAIEAYEKAGQKERADKEKKELKILSQFLPEEISDDELGKIIDETVKELGVSNMQDMGRAIGAVMAKVKGRADGKKVSDMVRAKLSGQ
jgi:uncharacterized protein YqeY